MGHAPRRRDSEDLTAVVAVGAEKNTREKTEPVAEQGRAGKFNTAPSETL